MNRFRHMTSKNFQIQNILNPIFVILSEKTKYVIEKTIERKKLSSMANNDI